MPASPLPIVPGGGMQQVSRATRWSLPIAGVGILILGVIRVYQGGVGEGYALVAASLILTGVLIGVYVHALWGERDHTENVSSQSDDALLSAGRGGLVESWQDRWALPFIAAGVMFGGVIRIRDSGAGEGFALLASGLILVGVWITTYLHDRWFGVSHVKRRGEIQRDVDTGSKKDEKDDN